MSSRESLDPINSSFEEFDTTARVEQGLKVASEHHVEADALAELVTRAESSLTNAAKYMEQANAIKKLANQESSEVYGISRQLPADKIWQLDSREKFTVIVPAGRSYQANTFHAVFIRPVENGIEVLDSEENKVVIPYSDYSREKYPLSVVDQATV